MVNQLSHFLKRTRQQHIIRIQPKKPLSLCLCKPLVQRVALSYIWLNVAILDDYLQIIAKTLSLQ